MAGNDARNPGRGFRSYSTSDELLVPRLTLRELLEGARESKPAHVGELRRRFGDQLYGAIYNLAPGSASEIVDDVFLRLPALLSDYQELGKFEAWLATVARNLAHTAGRSERTREARQTVLDDATPEQARTAGLSVERSQIRGRLLDSLNERQRDVWLLFEEGYSHKEIAARVGISVDNSQKILERARSVLREAYVRLLGPP